MEYEIVHLPQRISVHQKQQVKHLAKLFREDHLLKKKDHAHITFKYPFTASKIVDVEKVIEQLTKNHRAPAITIKRYITFHDRVICWKADFSSDANNIYDKLRKELRKIKWLQWDERDNIKGKFHIALIYTSSLENFKKAKKYLGNNKLNSHLTLDSLTIRKRLKKGAPWKVHKTYRFQ